MDWHHQGELAYRIGRTCKVRGQGRGRRRGALGWRMRETLGCIQGPLPHHSSGSPGRPSVCLVVCPLTARLQQRLGSSCPS